MKLTYWQNVSPDEQKALLARSAISESHLISQSVAAILARVKTDGDKALKALSQQFDNISLEKIKLSESEIKQATCRINPELKQAIELAAKNIECFHQAQIHQPITVETMPGITCQQVTRPIDSVGLYIPGGNAPLLSTVLMLAIPAKIAGCRNIILCSPPPIADEILYTAALCGVHEIYQLGGAQAIAAMAFGTATIPCVDKIFGPGNAYVTEAKQQVSQQIDGAEIDMPAGPSEVLVIADSLANSAFIAADLLSQAEHGADSQVILLTPDEHLAQAVLGEIDKQLALLSRQDIAQKALKQSRLIITKDIDECIEISNQYAPEHLIIQTQNAAIITDKITNAGSVFLGEWSPESVGDYASGTNHVLPTYGFAKTYSSLGLADFQKRMTIQQLSPEGLIAIGKTVELMAEAELLTAHKNAVSLRLAALKHSALNTAFK